MTREERYATVFRAALPIFGLLLKKYRFHQKPDAFRHPV